MNSEVRASLSYQGAAYSAQYTWTWRKAMPADLDYELGYQLRPYLQDIAARVRNNASDLAKRVYHHRQQVEIDLDEYTTLSESAAFLAFIELGGNVDDPHGFNWLLNHNQLVTCATGYLRRDLQEKGSEAHDIHYRETVRREAACVEQYKWSAWDDKAEETRYEREQIAEILAPLIPELRALLKPREVEFLTWKYVEGLSQEQIAARLNVKVGTVAMGTMRAKNRARELLGPRWASVAADVVRAA